MVTHKIIVIYPLICETFPSKNEDLYAKLEKIMKYDMTDKVQELKICLEFLNFREINIRMTLFEIYEFIYLKMEEYYPIQIESEKESSEEMLLKKRTIKEFEKNIKQTIYKKEPEQQFEMMIEKNLEEDSSVSLQKSKQRKVIDMSEYLHTYNVTKTDFVFFKYNRLINFSFIDLDPNFNDFFQKHLYRTCELCHKYPWGETMAVC